MTDTPKREPLLSDEYLSELEDKYWDDELLGIASWQQVRDHYENLIDTGVLMVVKTVGKLEYVDRGMVNRSACDGCGAYILDHTLNPWEFCPGCGDRV